MRRASLRSTGRRLRPAARTMACLATVPTMATTTMPPMSSIPTATGWRPITPASNSGSAGLRGNARHEAGDIDDRPLVEAFADRAGIVAAGDTETQLAPLDGDQFDLDCDGQADRRRRRVADVDMGADGMVAGDAIEAQSVDE